MGGWRQDKNVVSGPGAPTQDKDFGRKGPAGGEGDGAAAGGALPFVFIIQRLWF